MRQTILFVTQRQCVALALSSYLLMSCSGEPITPPMTSETVKSRQTEQQKPVVYQVFTRLFGNKNTTNKPWGTIEENGTGKFSDFTPDALAEIKAMGVSHIWYTGVPHHAVVTDYTRYGISQDDPDVVKGRAGSPYAVKDYYNVDPDLADDPANRLAEFDQLIERTHAQGMKVIIDIVPNHVARNYHSVSAPPGVEDFGANDDSTVTYARDNNFYYVVDTPFTVPHDDHYQVLGGASHPLADGQFDEVPAKWTGNGARTATPSIHDWYETVKINYGVRPDGAKDFPSLPASYADKPVSEHARFWADKSLPDSWIKFRDIALYWLDRGVDGFRYDMAEMVPVEFWSYLNSAIKLHNPDAFLLAEVYQPALYRDYLSRGKMDYLYDKVGFYDTLKSIMQGKGSVSSLLHSHQQVSDIAPSMLLFLENHDEQRIASEPFAGDARKGKPAMVVSSLISAAPIMLYFGQEVGEDGSEETGFGDPSRTTIFDYAGVPAHQRWMNNGAFDGGALSDDEQALRSFYVALLNLSASHPAVRGEMIPLHQTSLELQRGYTEQQLAFIRIADEHRLLVVANFDDNTTKEVTIALPPDVARKHGIKAGQLLTEKLTGTLTTQWRKGQGHAGLEVTVSLSSLESLVFDW